MEVHHIPPLQTCNMPTTSSAFHSRCLACSGRFSCWRKGRGNISGRESRSLEFIFFFACKRTRGGLGSGERGSRDNCRGKHIVVILGPRSQQDPAYFLVNSCDDMMVMLVFGGNALERAVPRWSSPTMVLEPVSFFLFRSSTMFSHGTGLGLSMLYLVLFFTWPWCLNG
jgi:hypothetical protein